MKKFPQAVTEKIESYVYILKDPRNSKVFYIGNGIGNRLFEHINGDLKNENLSEKQNLIREIHNAGLEVEHYILRHGITKSLSLEIESACIDLLGLDFLKNEIRGHNTFERGIKSVNEVIQFYDAKIITIFEPSIIININKLYKRFMTEENLYKITKQAWKLGIKKNKAQYIIASYGGLVREVYKITDWYKINNRWGFNGIIAEKEIQERYKNQSLENYIKKGNRNPIKYTF